MAIPSFQNPFPEPSRLTPPPSLAESVPAWNIEDFYRTTGDAVSKLDRGVHPDLMAYQKQVREIILTREPTPSFARFAGEIRAMVVGLVAYRDRLLAIRGGAVHLETSHVPGDDQPHHITPKNPKARAAARSNLKQI